MIDQQNESNNEIDDINLVGQIDKINIEKDVIKIVITMNSTHLHPNQIFDLIFLYERPPINVVISDHKIILKSGE